MLLRMHSQIANVNKQPLRTYKSLITDKLMLIRTTHVVVSTHDI